MTKKIAVLGLGAMGSRMAERLLDAGHDVTVYNRTPERAAHLVDRGAKAAASPREAVVGADIAISVVRDDEASKDVWLDPERGAMAGLEAEAVAVESSTLTPAWVQQLGRAMTERGTAFVDAPVVGSRPQAEAGKLLYLVGGDAAVLERIEDVLLSMGSAAHHAGAVGAGAVMKLAVNALFAIQVEALGEVLGMTRRAGIADPDAVEILSAMPVTSPALAGAGALRAARKFDPLFPVALVEKDLRYLVETAHALDTEAPAAATARSVFRRAIEAGYGEDNIVGVTKVFD